MTEEQQNQATFHMEELSDTPDRVNAEGNHRIRIGSVTQKDSKTTPGNQYLLIFMRVADQPEAADFRTMLMLPTAGGDEDQNLRRRQDIKEFFQAFGLPIDQEINFSDMVGAEADALLNIKSDDYGTSSNLVAFVS